MIRDLSQEMLRRRPQNRSYAKLACYMDLLMGSRMEISADAARLLAEAAPDDGESRLLIAFGHYRMGNLAAAKAECARVNVRELPPSYRAVAAAILGAVGEKIAAVAVSEELPKSLLLNEEVSLISPWLPIY